MLSASDPIPGGVKHSVLKKGAAWRHCLHGKTNPDYFQLVNRGGKGLEPVGYGYRLD